MKKAILVSLFAATACGAAFASDGGIYYETETVNKHISVQMDTTTYNAPRHAVVKPRPCTRASVTAKPIRVKTYTEVIDHYQVYQPVTVYQPVGTYSKRRIIEVPHCNRCNG